ncbi:MAG: hypothetical protein U1C96_10535 [Gallionella sp.]|nr:hypothetical protein [Gallionella sp.]
MRFFTDHFFSAEQKDELLGDPYVIELRKNMDADLQARIRDIRREQKNLLMQANIPNWQEEPRGRAELTGMFLLPLILSAAVIFGLLPSYLIGLVI